MLPRGRPAIKPNPAADCLMPAADCRDMHFTAAWPAMARRATAGERRGRGACFALRRWLRSPQRGDRRERRKIRGNATAAARRHPERVLARRDESNGSRRGGFCLGNGRANGDNPGMSNARRNGRLTPAGFVEKWRRVTLPERAASQEHFIDLCRLPVRYATKTANADSEQSPRCGEFARGQRECLMLDSPCADAKMRLKGGTGQARSKGAVGS